VNTQSEHFDIIYLPKGEHDLKECVRKLDHTRKTFVVYDQDVCLKAVGYDVFFMPRKYENDLWRFEFLFDFEIQTNHFHMIRSAISKILSNRFVEFIQINLGESFLDYRIKHVEKLKEAIGAKIDFSHLVY